MPRHHDSKHQSSQVLGNHRSQDESSDQLIRLKHLENKAHKWHFKRLKAEERFVQSLAKLNPESLTTAQKQTIVQDTQGIQALISQEYHLGKKYITAHNQIFLNDQKSFSFWGKYSPNEKSERTRLVEPFEFPLYRIDHYGQKIRCTYFKGVSFDAELKAYDQSQNKVSQTNISSNSTFASLPSLTEHKLQIGNVAQITLEVWDEHGKGYQAWANKGFKNETDFSRFLNQELAGYKQFTFSLAKLNHACYQQLIAFFKHNKFSKIRYTKGANVHPGLKRQIDTLSSELVPFKENKTADKASQKRSLYQRSKPYFMVGMLTFFILGMMAPLTWVIAGTLTSLVCVNLMNKCIKVIKKGEKEKMGRAQAHFRDLNTQEKKMWKKAHGSVYDLGRQAQMSSVTYGLSWLYPQTYCTHAYYLGMADQKSLHEKSERKGVKVKN